MFWCKLSSTEKSRTPCFLPYHYVGILEQLNSVYFLYLSTFFSEEYIWRGCRNESALEILQNDGHKWVLSVWTDCLGKVLFHKNGFQF